MESAAGVAAPAIRLAAFVRDLTAYVPARAEAAVRRSLCSPYSGVPTVDARALCAVAGERGAVAAAIASQVPLLAHPSAVAARHFVATLDQLARVYRAQGATAREFLRTIELAFDFPANLDESERTTLAALESVADRLDAAPPAPYGFDVAAFCNALERFARDERGKRPPGARPVPAVQPFAPRKWEAPSVVPRRKTHFSASSLNMFAQCERRWYYRYVCAAVEDRGSSASFYGSAFHWALERFHQEFPRADAAPQSTLERALDAHLQTAFERYRAGFESNVEFELQRRRALRTGRRYLAWFLRRAATAPFEVVGTELAVELGLDGHEFIGYIDRLDRDDRTGNVTVIDYKTGSIAESAEEYRDGVARFVDFQLPFYYFARTAAGDRVSALALVPLKDALADVTPLELDVVPVATPRTYSDAPRGAIGLDELERARVRMGELASTLANAPLERFRATDDPDACAYCTYANACRERPPRREDRFGR